jgi:hemocyanin-like protein
MHQQMLARYDTERLAAGLGRVVPFGDYRKPVAEAYDPRLPSLAPRRAGLTPQDVPEVGVAIDELESWRDDLDQAIDRRAFAGGRAVTADLLGATEESTVASVAPGTYGASTTSARRRTWPRAT